ncbi:hypothetical protein [Pseudomonas sp. UM16]|uniref:hypothetical protein n=1 Tax=Pseudomonas sp. UM16 TaxID=3158962 RepID=UPI00398FB9F5
MSEQEVCITTVVTRLWGNQMAIYEAPHALALLLTETGQPEPAERVMQVLKKLLDSRFKLSSNQQLERRWRYPAGGFSQPMMMALLHRQSMSECVT